MHKGLALFGAMLFLAATTAAQDSPAAASSSAPPSGTPLSLPAAPPVAAPGGAPRSSRSRNLDNSSWQLGFGYSYTRFNKYISEKSVSENGINTSIAYFFDDSLAIEGETAPGFGNTGGQGSHFLFYGGGVRIADRNGRRFEPWAHALFGGARFYPRVTGLDSIAYEVGGGVDWRISRQFSFRVQGDWIGTRFFNTSQDNIKVAPGIVFKF